MSKEKENLIKRSADNFKKLPEDKKVFVLGIMQGILISQTDAQNQLVRNNKSFDLA